MLFINDKISHIQAAKDIHKTIVTCYIKRKIFGKSPTSICKNTSCVICNSRIRKQPLSKKLKKILENIPYEKIAGGLPNELLRIHKRFQRDYKSSSISKTDSESLKRVFNYEWFEDKKNRFYNAYMLCENLKIETCIYCNRLYTSTVISNKRDLIIRPTLDHWFSKKSFPILALSFYNLIPSCTPCNTSVKHELDFDLKRNVHPYIDDLTSNYLLKVIYDKSLHSFKVRIKSKDSRILDTLKKLQIEEIYGQHQSELFDLDLLSRKYNQSYLSKLNKILGTSLRHRDVYRIMFGVEYEDENFHKRPLSKLKKDVLNFKLK